jgi:protocatechuate 3,4-dioxygenase beta subunit
MKKYIFVLFFILFLPKSYGFVVDIFSPKKATPSSSMIDTLSKPEKFSESSNLISYPGSFYVATGELLYFKGTVTDSFGIPIAGASIRIWQTNSAGKYQTLLKEDDSYVDSYFTTSGTAITDNLGRYGFKTVFPGFQDDRAPHINIIIAHKDFGEIQTEVYFEKHPLNEEDPIYSSYPKEDIELLTAKVLNVDQTNTKDGKIAIFNIIMDGIHSYKEY